MTLENCDYTLKKYKNKFKIDFFDIDNKFYLFTFFDELSRQVDTYYRQYKTL